MTDIAISVENLSKRYRIGQREERPETILSALRQFVRRPWTNLRSLRRLSKFETTVDDAADVIWALKDVSFEVKQGERIGIIGRNGAGKSTLLKVLSRITKPTSGRVTINGRTSSLLEVGTGFHPDLTGRENVYLNGALLGMQKTEIDRKFDEIVSFSGVEKFIDTPIKRYSSGMGVRLAFSVASHLDSEIMIIDEVLAVGDIEFQRKCMNKLSEVSQEGRTILLVSHSMGSVTNICSSAYLLNNGLVESAGKAQEVVKYYEAQHEPASSNRISLNNRLDRNGDGRIRLTGFEVRDTNYKIIEDIMAGDEINLVILYKSKQPNLKNVNFSIVIKDNVSGQRLTILNPYITQDNFKNLPSAGKVVCHIPKFPLGAGTYMINLKAEIEGIPTDVVGDAASLRVIKGDYYGTGNNPVEQIKFFCEHDWHFRENSEI